MPITGKRTIEQRLADLERRMKKVEASTLAPRTEGDSYAVPR